MMHRIVLSEVNPVWFKLASYVAVMFFVFMTDGMLSDFVPGLLESRLGSTWAMGLVMATSSVAGIILDISFAQLLRGFSVQKMIRLAIMGGVIFVGLLYGVIYWPVILLMVAAMASWGLYYEFFGFAAQQYVAEIATPTQRPGVWSILEMTRSIAYSLAPIIGAWLLAYGEKYVLYGAWIILSIAFLAFSFVRIPTKPVELRAEEIDLRAEIGHWIALGRRAWPVLIMSFLFILIDATYWSIGTIINDELASQQWWGGLLMTSYMIPPLFVGIVIVKLGIARGKKRIAQLLVLLSGLCLMLFNVYDQVWWYLLVTFIASVALSFAWPLTDAVYTDLIVRMGRERKHLIGLCSSMNSLGYIVGPIIAGFLASIVGNYNTFLWLGGLIAVVSLSLVLLTPRKIRLPQEEIQKWE